jgi:TrpR-related protein YerC/YecD
MKDIMAAFDIEPELRSQSCADLYAALAKVRSADEAAMLLRDILTYEEIEEAARRLEVARLLARKQTFREISSRTKMSSATIARIGWWLHHGTGGYRLALERLSKGKT